MALAVKKGTFAFPDSGSNFSVTGVGFQPKAVIFWMTRQSAEGYLADKALSVGWAVSSTQRGCLAFFADDAATVNSSNGSMIRNDFCLKAVNVASNSASSVLDADFVSMDADGFTIAPVNISVGEQYIVHYMAIGGITSAYAGVFTNPTTAGSQAYTGVGFQPDCLLVLSNMTGTVPRADVGHRMSLGVASSATDQAVASIGSQNAIPSALTSVQKTGEILHVLNFNATDHTVAALTSFDADGFTFNFTTAPGSARGFLVLALKGEQYKVAADTQKTSTGTKAKIGVGFTPTGLLLFGTNRASSASADSTLASLSIGGSDGTNEGATWNGSTDNVSTTDENSATVTTKILRHATNPSTTNAEANLSSFDVDGYTLDWTTADATAREFIGLAFGSTASAVTGSASLSVTAGVTTTGTRVKTGASSSTITVGITTTGSHTGIGAVSQSVTVGIATTANRGRFGSSSSTYAVGIASSGSATNIVVGGLSQAFTLGISTAGAQNTFASVSLEITTDIVTRGIRGKSITLSPKNESTITLDPKEPGVLP